VSAPRIARAAHGRGWRAGSARRVSAAVTLALASLACDRQPRAIPPLHLLLVTTEGLRADHLSAYVYSRTTSSWEVDPGQRAEGRNVAIDDLAEQGVLFESAFTPAVDTPTSLASLFTGHAPPLGMQLTGLPAEAFTLAERFQDAGFTTAAFVTGEPLSRAGGFDQGFDVYQHKRGDTQVLSSAVRWLFDLDLGGGKPLFLWIHLAGAAPPHEPFAIPPVPGPEADELDYVALFIDPARPASLRARDYAKHFSDPAYTGAADGSHEFLARADAREVELDAADRTHLVDLYDGEVAQLASLVRSFLLAFQAVTVTDAAWQRTLLVLAGVNGVELGEHGGWGLSLHPGCARVPLLFRHPDSITGSRVLAEVVDLPDVAPTVCDWFEIEMETGGGERDGRSLRPLLRPAEGGAFTSRAAVTIAPEGGHSAALRTPSWSLVWRRLEDGREEVQLFDRVRDPLDLRDLSPSQPVITHELRNEAVRLTTRLP
jgi:arylsulfatase A-like enzyme